MLYSHLLKRASEEGADGGTDLWVPDLNLPIADMLPADYVQSDAVRLEIYGRIARCCTEDDLEDLEDETARRFGKLPPAAREFFAAARLRLECKRRGIMRLDVGPEAVAASFLPGRLRKSKAKALERDGDRVVYASNRNANPFERVSDFLELLDD
jgi:transcription-repair coupling factor (superfamily II helicase)